MNPETRAVLERAVSDLDAAIGNAEQQRHQLSAEVARLNAQLSTLRAERDALIASLPPLPVIPPEEEPGEDPGEEELEEEIEEEV